MLPPLTHCPCVGSPLCLLLVAAAAGRSSTGALGIHAALIPRSNNILLWTRQQASGIAYDPGMEVTPGEGEVSSLYNYETGEGCSRDGLRRCAHQVWSACVSCRMQAAGRVLRACSSSAGCWSRNSCSRQSCCSPTLSVHALVRLLYRHVPGGSHALHPLLLWPELPQRRHAAGGWRRHPLLVSTSKLKGTQLAAGVQLHLGCHVPGQHALFTLYVCLGVRRTNRTACTRSLMHAGTSWTASSACACGGRAPARGRHCRSSCRTRIGECSSAARCNAGVCCGSCCTLHAACRQRLTVLPPPRATPSRSRRYPTQVQLPDDRTLIIAGFATGSGPPVPSLEVFDYRSGAITSFNPHPWLLELGANLLYPGGERRLTDGCWGMQCGKSAGVGCTLACWPPAPCTTVCSTSTACLQAGCCRTCAPGRLIASSSSASPATRAPSSRWRQHQPTPSARSRTHQPGERPAGAAAAASWQLLQPC